MGLHAHFNSALFVVFFQNVISNHFGPFSNFMHQLSLILPLFYIFRANAEIF